MKIEKKNEPIDSDLLLSSQLFHERWIELEKNWKDLHKDRKSTEVVFLTPMPGKVWSTGLDHNHHRLKGLYLDFRFFDAQKEVTNFKRMCNQVSNEFDSQVVRNAMKTLKGKWDNVSDFRKWHDYTFPEIVDLLFNASLFHQDQLKMKKFKSLMDAFNDETLHTLMVVCLKERLECIKYLDWALEPIRAGEQKIQIS